MKKIIFFSVTLLLFTCIGCATSSLVKISDNIFSYVDQKDGSPANSYGANAVMIEGKNCLAVIDTMISAKKAKGLIKDIRAISRKPIKYVVNTHNHLDHSFGNAEFVKLGAEIVSHINCKINMEKTAKQVLKNAKMYGLTPKDIEGTEIAYPNITFDNQKTINMGNMRIELIYVAPSHTNGSILVHIPEKKLLIAGDILFTDYHPFVGDGNIEGWVKNLDYINQMDVNLIIPGHGPLSSKKDVLKLKEYLIQFDSMAKSLCSSSKDVDFIVDELKKSLPERSRGEDLIKFNILSKYLGAH